MAAVISRDSGRQLEFFLSSPPLDITQGASGNEAFLEHVDKRATTRSQVALDPWGSEQLACLLDHLSVKGDFEDNTLILYFMLLALCPED